jgi:hypothetical protein
MLRNESIKLAYALRLLVAGSLIWNRTHFDCSPYAFRLWLQDAPLIVRKRISIVRQSFTIMALNQNKVSLSLYWLEINFDSHSIIVLHIVHGLMSTLGTANKLISQFLFKNSLISVHLFSNLNGFRMNCYDNENWQERVNNVFVLL